MKKKLLEIAVVRATDCNVWRRRYVAVGRGQAGDLRTATTAMKAKAATTLARGDA